MDAGPRTPDLAADVDRVAAETGFAGVVRVDRAGTTELSAAYGLADRRHGIAMTPDTQVGIASGSKGMTALAVMSLVEDGTLSLGTTARSLLGTDLPLIADDVTVEHLLGHTSGIGDYLDEDDDIPITAYAMTVPVHELDTTEAVPPRARRVPDGVPGGGPVLLLQRRVLATTLRAVARRQASEWSASGGPARLRRRASADVSHLIRRPWDETVMGADAGRPGSRDGRSN